MDTEKFNSICDILTEMVDVLSSAKTAVFNTDKVAIDRGQFMEYIREIREILPKEIEYSKTIIGQQNDLMAEAQAEADKIRQQAETDYKAKMAQAEEERETLIAETEIMQQASEKAGNLIEEGRKLGREFHVKARAYTDDLLAQTEGIMEQVGVSMQDSLDEIKRIMSLQQAQVDEALLRISRETEEKYNRMMAEVDRKRDIIAENRQELNGGKQNQ